MKRILALSVLLATVLAGCTNPPAGDDRAPSTVGGRTLHVHLEVAEPMQLKVYLAGYRQGGATYTGAEFPERTVTQSEYLRLMCPASTKPDTMIVEARRGGDLIDQVFVPIDCKTAGELGLGNLVVEKDRLRWFQYDVALGAAWQPIPSAEFAEPMDWSPYPR